MSNLSGPIRTACQQGNVKHIEEILINDINIDLNAPDRGSGETALMIASQCGHINCVHMLLKKGADWTVQDRNRETALQKAKNNGHDVVADMIEGVSKSIFHFVIALQLLTRVIGSIVSQFASQKENLELKKKLAALEEENSMLSAKRDTLRSDLHRVLQRLDTIEMLD